MTFFRSTANGALPQGDVFVTSFHYSSSQPLSAVHTLATGAWETFWGVLKVDLAPATVLQGITTTELNPNNGKNAFASQKPENIIGTGTAPTITQQACILITLRTANASRAGRGRLYLPPPVIGSVAADGTLSAARATAIDNAFGALISTMAGSGSVIVQHGGYAGRDAAGKPIYTVLSGDAVTSSQVNYVLATQRRRTNKVTHGRTT